MKFKLEFIKRTFLKSLRSSGICFLLLGAVMANAMGAELGGWTVVSEIKWSGAPLANGATVLSVGAKPLTGILQTDSKIGAYLLLEATAQSPDNKLNLTAIEIDERGQKVGKFMPTQCTLSNGQTDCKMLTYVGPGPRRIMLRFISFYEKPVNVVDLKVSKWEATRISPSEHLSEYQAIFERIKELYWKSSDIDWSFISAQSKLALTAPREVNPIPYAVNRIISMLPSSEHTWIVNDTDVTTELKEEPVEMPVCIRPKIGVVILSFPGTPKKTVHEKEYIEAGHKCLASARQGDKLYIDLRQQSGGSSTVLFASLQPVFGDGPLVNFVNGQKETTFVTLHRGSIVYKLGAESRELYQFVPGRKLLTSKIKFIIGPGCASACETVAIAALKRFNILGQPSGGLTTGNEAIDLPNGLVLQITAGQTATIDGKIIYPHVNPDKLVSDAEMKILLNEKRN